MAVGETVTAVPLVTAPTLWSTLPVPLEKTAVRVVEAPAVMVLLAAAKLVNVHYAANNKDLEE